MKITDRNHAIRVARLVECLDAHEVELPTPLLDGARHLLQLGELLGGPRDVNSPGGLLDLDEAELVQALQDTALKVSIHQGHGAATPAATEAIPILQLGLAKEIAEAIQERADEILDQLRPSFDKHAATICKATRLGITPETRAEDIVNIGADSIAETAVAWHAIEPAAEALDAIASIRLDLTQLAGVAPGLQPADQYDDAPEISDLARVMFRAEGLAWHVVGEGDRQKWIRLCTGKAATLLTTAQVTHAWSTLQSNLGQIRQAEHAEKRRRYDEAAARVPLRKTVRDDDVFAVQF